MLRNADSLSKILDVCAEPQNETPIDLKRPTGQITLEELFPAVGFEPATCISSNSKPLKNGLLDAAVCYYVDRKTLVKRAGTREFVGALIGVTSEKKGALLEALGSNVANKRTFEHDGVFSVQIFREALPKSLNDRVKDAMMGDRDSNILHTLEKLKESGFFRI